MMKNSIAHCECAFCEFVLHELHNTFSPLSSIVRVH